IKSLVATEELRTRRRVAMYNGSYNRRREAPSVSSYPPRPLFCYHQPFASMKIHEYQAKSILARHGVPVPRGEVAFSVGEAGEIARRLGGRVVVKAQIHAGGRGKGGGVKLAQSADDAERLARDMI